ncbi:molecular chaperone Tir [archaeon]|nr:MAG: molecular chaperone Tir [archaeon]
MAYRNKTFVSFASEDIHAYRLMQAWTANQHIDFSFLDAHDLNTARDSSLPDTIRRRLSERLTSTKQVVMLLSSVTRSKAGDPTSFLYHEANTIHRLNLPVVFVNLDGSRNVESHRIPDVLAQQYSICVSFQPTIVQYALDGYVDTFNKNLVEQDSGKRRSGPHYYKPETYRGLGL